MFKVPDWDEGEDNTKSSLKKKTKNSQKQEANGHPKTFPKKVKANNSAPVTGVSRLKENKKEGRKRKLNGQTRSSKKNKNQHKSLDISNLDTDKADEILLNAKKKKFYEPIEQDDREDVLFQEEAKKLSPANINRKILPTSIDNKPANNKILKNGKQTVPNMSQDKISQNQVNNEKKSNSQILVKTIARKNKNKLKKKVKQIMELKNKNTENSSETQDTVEQENFNILSNSQKSNRKKEKIKALLQAQSLRNSISTSGDKLRQRMLERLKAAKFRYLNEKLYTSSGEEAKELFAEDPMAFNIYHEGYQQQLKKWPINPLDVIVKRILKMPKTHTIADMGCGEAALSRRVPQSVRSFDLVSAGPGVESCDMAHTPLLSASVDVAVYCLALMGTQLTQYLVEANRVLKTGGHLLIAEVESRFHDVEAFTKEVAKLGFKLKNLDKQHKVFFFMEFIKVRDPPVKKSKLPVLTLKPCLYKKR